MTPSSTHLPSTQLRNAARLHIRIKVTVRPRQEFVVGGWHPGERGLAGKFGSLLVGVYAGDKLRYAGKVGTGYTDRERDRVGALLAGLAADEPPFDPAPPREASRTAHWVRPMLVPRQREARGLARSMVARRLSTVAEFYRSAEQEGLIARSPAVHVRRPRLDYESHTVGLDRNELGALLVAAGLAGAREHALISLLALNWLRIPKLSASTSAT